MSGTPAFDVVIIGGGITGAGTARDAALRGLRVALVEKGDFASGTSSKSSKLVHGGLRYLEQGEIRLVFEGTNERALQMRRAPHLVRPIPFLFPVYRHARRGLLAVDLGLWVYDGLAMFKNKLHRTYRSAQRVLSKEPAIRPDGLVGAIEYVDCLTDDARLTLENIVDARDLGADVMSYTRAIRVDRDAAGRVAGVRVRDEMTGDERSLRTELVIIAGGPWTDELLGTVGIDLGHRVLRPTKGVHCVFDAARLPITRAITYVMGDGRLIFAIPWVERTVIGTTDTDFDGSPDDVHAEACDVQYLCDAANSLFPAANVGPGDVIATWAGLRPLIAPPATGTDPSSVSREHETIVRHDGVIYIAGGKLTTYRRMAKELVDHAIAWLGGVASGAPLRGRELDTCTTRIRPLPGAVGLKPRGAAGVRALVAALVLDGIPERVALHLCQTYGTRAPAVVARGRRTANGLEPLDPELPYVWIEVEVACRDDLARTIDDVLTRRIPLALRARGQGVAQLESVADRMAAMLGWSQAERTRQVAAYAQIVAAGNRWR